MMLPAAYSENPTVIGHRVTHHLVLIEHDCVHVMVSALLHVFKVDAEPAVAGGERFNIKVHDGIGGLKRPLRYRVIP